MSNNNAQQAGWFLCVGATAAGTHALVLAGVVHFLSMNPVWANVVAFACAFVVSFIGHYFLTFRSQNTRSFLHSLGKWLATSCAGFALNQLLFVIGINILGDQYYLVAWFIATVLVTVMTFAAGKFWAFSAQ